MPDAGVPMNGLINLYSVVCSFLAHRIPFYDCPLADNFTKDFTNQ